MNDNKTSGFARLRGLAAAATVGFGAMAVPGTAGVAGRIIGPTIPASSTRETRFSVSKAYGPSSATRPTASMRWLGIGNGQTTVSTTYTTTTYEPVTEVTSGPRSVTVMVTVTSGSYTTSTSTIYFTSTTQFPSLGYDYTSCFSLTGSTPTEGGSPTGSPSTLWSCSAYNTTLAPSTTQIPSVIVTSEPMTVTVDTITRTGVVVSGIRPTDTGFQISDGVLENGFTVSRRDITEEFVIIDGPRSRGDLFDGILKMDVNGEDFINPGGVVQFDGDTVTTNTMTDVIDGIDASMQLFFSGELPFVRAMYVLENTTESDIAAQLAVNGDVAYEGNTTVQATSDGDAVAEDGDRWVAVNDSGSVGTDGEGDVILVTRYGTGATVVPTSEAALGDGEADVFRHVYDVTVPAGGKARVIVFVGVADSLESGQNMAAVFTQDQELLLEDLSDAELDEVVNYGDVPQIAQDLSDDGLELLGSTGWISLLGGFGLMLRRRRQH